MWSTWFYPDNHSCSFNINTIQRNGKCSFHSVLLVRLIVRSVDVSMQHIDCERQFNIKYSFELLQMKHFCCNFFCGCKRSELLNSVAMVRQTYWKVKWFCFAIDWLKFSIIWVHDLRCNTTNTHTLFAIVHRCYFIGFRLLHN